MWSGSLMWGAGSGAVAVELSGAGRGEPFEQERDGGGVGDPALRPRRGVSDLHGQARGGRGLFRVRGDELLEGGEGVLVGDVVAEVRHRGGLFGSGQQPQAVALRRLIFRYLGAFVSIDDSSVGVFR